MVIYVKNNFNASTNNKKLSVLRRWTRSLYYMTVMPGDSTEPIELPDLDDDIIVTIAPDSPMRECIVNSRVTYDETIEPYVDITPPSVMLDYPYSVEVKGNKKKISIAPGRHDWQVSIVNPLKAVDRWTSGLDPATAPAELTVIIGDDIET